MTQKPLAVLFLLLCLVSTAVSQVPNVNPDAPKPRTAAPELTFTHLLHAPPEAKVDWTSLRGKVVVLEFWATWCVPCIAEIPVLNSLAASADPAKVQFISVDDEDSALVESFLQKHPTSGWIGIDTTGKTFERFGVTARPATMVIDPQGRVVSTTTRPEQLTSTQLVALADGKPVMLGGEVTSEVTPKMQAERNAAMAQAVSAQASRATDSSSALFEIRLTPGDPVTGGKEPDTHAMSRGAGQIDVTNGSPADLLSTAAGIPSTRITVAGDLPNTLYNLHVDAANADAKQLSQAIELAIATGAHLHIEHRTAVDNAYVLTASPGAQAHLVQSRYGGGAFYGTKSQTLQCINATLDQVAGALEKALGTPVVNEAGVSGKLMLNLKIVPKDLASAKSALGGIGLELTAAQRPIETITLSAAAPAKVAAQNREGTQ